MPQAKDSFALQMFGAPDHRYVVLGVRNRQPFAKPPKHLFSVPQGWQVWWGNDYTIAPQDFVPRRVALSDCACANLKSLSEAETGDGSPDDWCMVFRVGEWDEENSYLTIFNHPDDCSLMIKTSIQLVRPSAAEIAEFGGIDQKAGAA